MNVPARIDATIVGLFDIAPGESQDLAIRQFADDMEAHDPELQERYASQMASNFQAATDLIASKHGAPPISVAWDAPEYDSWIERLPLSFNQLVAWPRDDGHYFYILNHHEDRELPLLVMAGVTD